MAHKIAHTYEHILLHQILMFGKMCDLEHCVGLMFNDGRKYIH
jgi:hypothetical protein